MKKTVICVDDEDIVLNSLEMELSSAKADFEIETAKGGEEALELINELIKEKAEIAVIVTDYIMPSMKGDELLIQTHKRLPACANILLTGQSQLKGVTNAINHANLYRFIEKPWKKADLLLTIRNAIRKYDSEKKLTEQKQVITDLNNRLQDNRIEIKDSTITEEQIFIHSMFAKYFQALSPKQKLWFGNACVGLMSADGKISKNEMLYVNTLCSAHPEKEYVYHIVKLLKEKKRPKLDNLCLSSGESRKMMQFLVQILINDQHIKKQEQLYIQYAGSKLGLIEPLINDFIKLGYQKLQLEKMEKKLLSESENPLLN